MWNSAGQNVPKCADDYDLGDWVSENEGGKLRYVLLAPRRRRQAAAKGQLISECLFDIF